MMSFSDDDLESLTTLIRTGVIRSELDPSGEDTIAFRYKISALLARLQAAEKVCDYVEKVYDPQAALELEAWRKAAGK